MLVRVAQAGGTHHCNQIVQRNVDFVIDYNVVKFGHMAHFPACAKQAAADHLVAVGAATAQSRLELFHRRRHDEDADRLREGLAHLLGTLPVDLEQGIATGRDLVP